MTRHVITLNAGSSSIKFALYANLRKLIPLAPLHQPHNIAGIEAAQEALPHVRQVACFDTLMGECADTALSASGTTM